MCETWVIVRNLGNFYKTWNCEATWGTRTAKFEHIVEPRLHFVPIVSLFACLFHQTIRKPIREATTISEARDSRKKYFKKSRKESRVTSDPLDQIWWKFGSSNIYGSTVYPVIYSAVDPTQWADWLALPKFRTCDFKGKILSPIFAANYFRQEAKFENQNSLCTMLIM